MQYQNMFISISNLYMLFIIIIIICIANNIFITAHTIKGHTKQCVDEFYPILIPTAGTKESKIAEESQVCKVIHFIRHAEGFHNVADRKHGTDILKFENSGNNFTDAKLTENGIRQSQALKKRIQNPKGSYAKWTIVNKVTENFEERYLDIDAIVTSTLSRAIETAFYGLPVSKNTIHIATELGRERVAEYMCEKRRNLSEIEKDYPFVQITHATSEEDDRFDEKETEDDLLKARIRARKFLKWLLFETAGTKFAYVSHFEFLQLIFDDFFKKVDNRRAAFRDKARGEDQIFPWIFEFRNAQILPAYLCPSNLIEDQILCLNDEAQVKYEIDQIQKNGPIFSKKSPQQYKGKAGSHAPLAFQSIKTREITVKVEHGMSDEHFIEYVYLRDVKTKEIVAFKKFSKEMANDKNLHQPILKFMPEKETEGRVRPYAYCNKHGLWKGPAISYL